MFFSWKSSAYLALFAALVAETNAHMSMGFPVPRSHPNNPNAVKIDYECIMAPLTGHPDCPRTPFPCKGYPRDSKITQSLRAGQLIEVKFFNQLFPNGPKPGDENKDQARHSGGLCQFSLSVDNGRTFRVIAEYTRGCPDIFFTFPVRIPNDVPSSDSAIFAWSWINATGNREFYMNCADVKLIGVAGGRLTGPEITKANIPGVQGFNNIITPPMDVPSASNAKGPGPSQEEKRKNSLPKGGVPSSPSPIISRAPNPIKNVATSPSPSPAPVEQSPPEEVPEPADEEPSNDDPSSNDAPANDDFNEEPAADVPAPNHSEEEGESNSDESVGEDDDFDSPAETPLETPIETPEIQAQSARRKCKGRGSY